MKTEQKKKYEVGLGILRVFLSYMVVLYHYLRLKRNTNKLLKKFFKLRNYAVPTFFLMSFYFMYSGLKNKKIKKIRLRFERLIISYLIWPFVFWIINYILAHKYEIKLKHSFKDLSIQYIYGRDIILPFWYQWNLIVVTFIYVAVIVVFKDNYAKVIELLGLFSTIAQYSGFNYKLLKGIKLEQKRLTLGRFIELMPFSCLGFIFAENKILEKLENKWIINIFLCLIGFSAIERYILFVHPKGFLYEGLKLQIGAVLIFFIFGLFPTHLIVNDKIIQVIKQISSYTFGIYSIHYPIGKYLTKKILNYKFLSMIETRTRN